MRSGTRIGGTVVSALIVLTLAACSASPIPGMVEAEPTEWSDVPAGSAEVGNCPWEPPSAATSSPDDSADPETVVERSALDEDRFWSLVEALPQHPEPSDFTTMSASLAGCGIDEVLAFEARLTLALYALDGSDIHAWYEANDPGGLGFVSDDVFLYGRCDTVLAGRANWQEAVSERTLVWGGAPEPDYMGEYLLYVSWDAAGALGFTVEEYLDLRDERIPLSYESGANTSAWE